MIENWLEEFLVSYDLTLRYFRGLKARDQVIASIFSFKFSNQCEVPIMKMIYCSWCAGYGPAARTCKDFCLNSMRGCLVDFFELAGFFNQFYNALVVLKDEVIRFNLFQAILDLQTHIHDFIRNTTENHENILQIVSSY